MGSGARSPRSIETLDELHKFPKLTKQVIQQRQDEIFTNANGARIEEAYSTGGTTGTPTRYPKGPGEENSSYANTFAARSWWGIRPFDSYVHVWGHAHLFAGGPVGKVKRKVQDALVNATRVNAYNMTAEALDGHARVIIRRNPTYLVGYTSALFKIARHIKDANIDTSRLTKLRNVIVTAETVSRADVDLIEEVFNAPVVIEYGAAETGVIAYSRGGTWPLQVLWHSFVLSVQEGSDLAITTLDDRLFPLVNYVIGDAVEGGDILNGNALTLGAVKGRSQDIVTVSTSSGHPLELSAILPIHILKSMPGVLSVQYRQEDRGQLKVFLTASLPLDLATVSERFADSMKLEHAEFDPASVVLKQVESPVLTKAGKQALFI